MLSVTALVCALLLVIVVGMVDARIEVLKVDHDERRSFHIESFGYEPNGVLEIELSDFQFLIPQSKVTAFQDRTNLRVALLLQRSESDGGSRVEDASPDACFHTDVAAPPGAAGRGGGLRHKSERDGADDEDIVIDLASVVNAPASAPTSTTAAAEPFRHRVTITRPGYYHLYFSNCERESWVSFTLKTTQYNVVGADGDVRVYLSAGEAQLPTFFLLLCGAFALATLMWVRRVRVARAACPSSVKRIHNLMTVVALFKVATLCTEAFKYHSLKVSGVNDGWAIAFYVFSSLKGVFLVLVVILIAFGWSYMKSYLTDCDKQIMVAVLVCQCLVNVAMVVLDATSPGDHIWLSLRDILHILDIVCWSVILLPIVRSIRHARAARATDGKADRSVNKLTRFRQFYLLVVAYVYVTRIIVYILETNMPFEYTWVGTVFGEVAALAFYCTTGYLFQPIVPMLVGGPARGDGYFEDEDDDASAQPLMAEVPMEM